MNSLEKLKLPPQFTIFRNTKNQEYRFIILKPWTQLVKKKKKKREAGRKEETLQILCVMCFAQTQKFYNTHHARHKLLYLEKLKINLKNILENIFDLN